MRGLHPLTVTLYKYRAYSPSVPISALKRSSSRLADKETGVGRGYITSSWSPTGVRSGHKHICWPLSQCPFLYVSIAFQKASTPLGPESSGRLNTRDHKESPGMKWLAPRPTSCVMEPESYIIHCGQGDGAKNSSPSHNYKDKHRQNPRYPHKALFILSKSTPSLSLSCSL